MKYTVTYMDLDSGQCFQEITYCFTAALNFEGWLRSQKKFGCIQIWSSRP